MRVIGGTFGGRRLRAAEGHATRPTSDRVREALFSRLEARYGLEGATVLDAFAGTGALAIEALSRGAHRAVCIELDRRALETLRGNLRELDLVQKVRVIGDDYRRVLLKLSGEAVRPGTNGGPAAGTGAASVMRPTGATTATRRRFDGVFLDPPYGKNLAVAALELIARLGLLKPGGWVTMEVGRREVTPEFVPASGGVLERVREDIYGDTKLALYEARAASRKQAGGGAGEPLPETATEGEAAGAAAQAMEIE